MSSGLPLLLALLLAPGLSNNTAKKDATGPLDQLSTIDKQLVQLGAKRRGLMHRREELDVALAEGEARLLTARNRQITASRRRVRRLGALHRLGKLLPAAILVGPTTLKGLHDRKTALYAVVRHDQRLASAHQRFLRELSEATLQANDVRKRLEGTLTELERVLSELREHRKARQLVTGRLKSDQSVAAVAGKELVSGHRNLQSLVSANQQGDPPEPLSAVDFESARGKLHPPASGVIRWNFGAERSKRFKIGLRHTGIDIVAEVGTEVRAVWSGQVVHADWLPGYGQVVIVRHDGPWHTVYAHLEATLVQRGAKLEPQQAIATIGNTGTWEGVHLHFEVRRGATAEDPRVWLAKK